MNVQVGYVYILRQLLVPTSLTKEQWGNTIENKTVMKAVRQDLFRIGDFTLLLSGWVKGG